jgi:hypothetical protein
MLLLDLLPLLHILVAGQEAVLIGVPFGEAFGGGGWIGLVGGVVVAGELAGFFFVEFVEAGTAIVGGGGGGWGEGFAFVFGFAFLGLGTGHLGIGADGWEVFGEGC